MANTRYRKVSKMAPKQLIKLDGNSNGSLDAIMSNEVNLPADGANMKNDYGLLDNSKNASNPRSPGITNVSNRNNRFWPNSSRNQDINS